MVLRLRQHNIGYTADGFYRSDDPTNSLKASESHRQQHRTITLHHTICLDKH